MITYIHFPTPDNKKPIHDFINNKAPYGTTIFMEQLFQTI